MSKAGRPTFARDDGKRWVLRKVGMKIICDHCDEPRGKVLLRNRDHFCGAVIGVDREMLLALQAGDDPLDGDTDELDCPCGATYLRREFLELEVE